MKLKLLKEIIDHIVKHPRTWEQSAWHCGTTHCLAGFCELKAAGYKLGARNDWSKMREVGSKMVKFRAEIAARGVYPHTENTAREYLDLTPSQANYLFAFDRTLIELKAVARTGKLPRVVGWHARS